MKTRLFWIISHLAILPKPNSNENLEEDIAHFKKQGVDILFSLLTKEEQVEIGLLEEENLCKKYNINFISFPIKDISVPSEEQTLQLRILAKELHQQIVENKKVAIHCGVGIGRSGMVSAAFLIESGIKAKEAIELISKARGFKILNTKEQEKCILNY